MTARLRFSLARSLALCFLLSLAAPSRAQDDAATSEPTSTAQPSARRPVPVSSARPVDRTRAPEPKADADPGDPHAPTTPRRALAGFLRACERGDFVKASESLDLRGLPRGREPREGPELASMLHRVLGWRVALDPDALPDEPEPAGVGAEGVVFDLVEVEGKTFSLALAPVRMPNGEVRWMFPRTTVAAIRTIYEANERLAVEERVPEWMKRSPVLGLFPWQWLGLVLVLAVAWAIGRGLGTVLAALLHRAARPFSRTGVDAAKGLERPVRLALGVVAVESLAPYLVLNLSLSRGIDKAATILYIVAAAWGAIAVVRVLTASWERRLPEDTLGDLESRGLRTRLSMVRRIGTVIVALIAAGIVLLQFEVVRSVGLSLLASAGIAGVLVGIAAQRTLGGIIAGIEMSITQPLRIGDVVVFRPDELGTVEEIYFTYVIVRLWDDRRLIVPVTRVMAEPFENWTRVDARLLAPVEIFVDYATPIDELRESFRALCEGSNRWDGRVCRVEVVDVTDKAVRVRGVASVDVATKAMDLRFELREGWIKWLQEIEDGRYLPVGRVESRTAPGEPVGTAPVGPPTGASGPPPG